MWSIRKSQFGQKRLDQSCRARPLPLGLALDPASDVPLHRQIGQQIRAAILDRRLAPGLRLPSSRLMAAELGCARGTILAGRRPARGRGLRGGAGGVGPLGRDQPARRDAGVAQGRRPPRPDQPGRARPVAPYLGRSRGGRSRRPDDRPIVRRIADRLPDRPARPRGLSLRPVGQAARARMAPARLGDRGRPASVRPSRPARRHRVLSRHGARLRLRGRRGRRDLGHAPEPVAVRRARPRCRPGGVDRGAGLHRHARGDGDGRGQGGAGADRCAGLRRRRRAETGTEGAARRGGAVAPVSAGHGARPAAAARAAELGRAHRRAGSPRTISTASIAMPAGRWRRCARSTAAGAWPISAASPSCSSPPCA